MTTFSQPWGWSKLDLFRTCKKKFEFQYIDKLPDPGNEAMRRGNKMHEDIEAYLQGWVTSLPPELIDWKDRFDELRQSNFTAEQALGLDKNWMVLPDWFDKKTWLRAKMDAKVLKGEKLTVIDFKSGKYRIPSEDQIELYSIVGLCLHPEVKEVEAEFWFIDQNDSYSKLYKAEELQALKKKFEGEANRIYDTQIWTESPSRDCKYCVYSKTRGGPCKY